MEAMKPLHTGKLVNMLVQSTAMKDVVKLLTDIDTAPRVDYHRQTASEMFGVPYEEVTPEQRRSAKAHNFGKWYT